MNLFAFYRSSIGKKVVMALTGAVLVLFVIGHMAGNLKTFGGFDAAGISKLDHYAEFLRTMGQDMLGREGALWAFRALLLGAVVLHILTAMQLVAQNAAARPQGYAKQRYSSATPASNTMVIGGLIIALFIVLHILHFTTGHLHGDGFVHGAVYSNIYASFSKGPITALYVGAMCVLWLHLYHGVWSIFQSLGVDAPGWNTALRRGAQVVAFAVCVGFMSVPVAIYFKMLPPPSGVTLHSHT